MEAPVLPEAIDLRRQGRPAAAKPAERRDMLVAYLHLGQCGGQRVVVKLRIGARHRHLADIDDPFDARGTQQGDELRKAAVGMADGEEWQRHCPLA